MTFWETFYNLCTENGTKPNPVAKEIGVSSATVTKWKNGATPSYETARKIADFFSVSVSYLMGDTDVGQTQEQWEEELLRDARKLSPNERQLVGSLVQSLIRKESEPK